MLYNSRELYKWTRSRQVVRRDGGESVAHKRGGMGGLVLVRKIYMLLISYLYIRRIVNILFYGKLHVATSTAVLWQGLLVRRPVADMKQRPSENKINKHQNDKC